MAPPSDTLVATQSSGASEWGSMIFAGVRTAMRSDFRLSVKPDSMVRSLSGGCRSVGPNAIHTPIVLTIPNRIALNAARVFEVLSTDLKQFESMARRSQGARNSLRWRLDAAS